VDARVHRMAILPFCEVISVMNNSFVLPKDVQIVPLSELPPEVRAQVQGLDHDFAVTRPLSRVPSKVIDAEAAELLREFRQPSTLIDGILRFSNAKQRKATEILEQACPFLESCLASNLLVIPGAASEAIRAPTEKGAVIADVQIEDCLQALADSELYRGRAGDRRVALKITRTGADTRVKQGFAREAAILELLNGRVSPKLFSSGDLADGRSYLAVEWIPGERAQEAADGLRANSPQELAAPLLALCCDILDTYAVLHCVGVIHSDVHPNNLLISANGDVYVIDYGFARTARGSDTRCSAAPRAGVPFFYEPEYAKAILASAAPPLSSFAGEQYAIAALLYMLLSGRSYLDFSYGRQEMLRQITEQPPIPLSARGLKGTAAVDDVLLRALSKNPYARFPDTDAMAVAFREAANAIAASTRNRAGTHASSAALKFEDSHGANRQIRADFLDSVLQRLSDPTQSLPTRGLKYPTASITYGAAGIGYGLFRIACAKDDAQLFALADRWMDRAESEIEQAAGFYHQDVQILPETVGSISPYHAPSGVACAQALLAHARGDLNTRAVATQRFVQFSDQDCENLDITLGRSSTLLALSLMLDAFRCESNPDVSRLTEIGNHWLDTCWQQFDAMPPIAESEPDTYLGMAHGWAGYLYATLRWMQSAGTAAPPHLDMRLRQLAAEANRCGRRASWPCQKKVASRSLAGWCNGSAGFVFLWTLAHRLSGDPQAAALAEAAGFDAWHPRDDFHSVCCGLAGGAYSQLHLYKHTRRAGWLSNARVMATAGVHSARRIAASDEPNIPLSLYKGDVGLAVLIAELERPDFAAMPFFEEETWPAAAREASVKRAYN
jgi:eukaryotic-like serine/threonine-protein kinase